MKNNTQCHTEQGNQKTLVELNRLSNAEWINTDFKGIFDTFIKQCEFFLF